MKHSRNAVAFFCASALFAGGAFAAPMDVKLGLWEVTLTNRITGAMTRSNTMSYKTCLTKKQLEEDPISQPAQAGQTCTTKMTSQTRTVWSGRRVCTGGEFDQDISGKVTALSREHVRGKLLIKGSMGGNMVMTNHATYDSKWIGPSCGAVQ